jgi:SAM-dependent methyltransferase
MPGVGQPAPWSPADRTGTRLDIAARRVRKTEPMPIAVLMPTLETAAIGERQAASRARAILGARCEELRLYHPDERAGDAVADIESDHVLVVTDPLLIADEEMPQRLLSRLERSRATAVLPSSNIAQHAAQRQTLAPYVTLREMREAASRMRETTDDAPAIRWDASDPLAYLCPTEFLDGNRRRLAAALEAEDVLVSRGDYVHRWIEESSARLELLRLVPSTARNILEIGCGDGFLAETVRQRQKCRYVGIESSAQHAAAARRHVGEIYRGDPEEIVSILEERFDCIIAGDAWNSVSEPWVFLGALRRLATADGVLVASVTNASHSSLVSDLLHGETPFVCAGPAAAATARPLTRSALVQLLTSAGWDVSQIIATDGAATAAREELRSQLAGAHEYSLDELVPLRYLALGTNGVVAR